MTLTTQTIQVGKLKLAVEWDKHTGWGWLIYLGSQGVCRSTQSYRDQKAAKRAGMRKAKLICVS